MDPFQRERDFLQQRAGCISTTFEEPLGVHHIYIISRMQSAKTLCILVVAGFGTKKSSSPLSLKVFAFLSWIGRLTLSKVSSQFDQKKSHYLQHAKFSLGLALRKSISIFGSMRYLYSKWSIYWGHLSLPESFSEPICSNECSEGSKNIEKWGRQIEWKCSFPLRFCSVGSSVRTIPEKYESQTRASS